MVGFGCFFAYITILKYYEFSKELYIAIDLIRMTFPIVIVAIIGFTPVMIGLIIVGVSSFGLSSKFDSVRNALISLLSLAYGDSINEIVLDTYYPYTKHPFYLAYCAIYIIILTVLFMTLVFAVITGLLNEKFENRNKIIEEENQYK